MSFNLTDYQNDTGIKPQLVCAKADPTYEVQQVLSVNQLLVMVLDANIPGIVEPKLLQPVVTASQELNCNVLLMHPAALIKVLAHMTKEPKNNYILFHYAEIPIGVETITIDYEELTQFIKGIQ